MIWLGASFVIQLICFLHVYQTGRDRMWSLVVLFFSLPGCFAYFVFEIMPGLIGPKLAKKRMEAHFDPVNSLGRAEAELAKVDTAANQIAVAEAYMEMAAYASAAEHFGLARDRMNGSDEGIETRLATALFESGKLPDALAALDQIERIEGKKEGDRIASLRARILDGLGQGEAAREIYAAITPRLHDPEIRCRYAALLLKLGDRGAARDELLEVEKQAPGLGRIEKERHADMLAWAKQELAGLRI